METVIILSTPVMLFLLWIFLIMIAEETDDLWLRLLQLPVGLFYGISLLDSNIWLGLTIICVSVYIGAILWREEKW